MRKLSSTTIALALAACVLDASRSTSGAMAPRARLTAEQLRAGLFQFHTSLRSIHVSYRMPYDPAYHPHQPSGAYVQRALAMRDSLLFKINAHGHDGMDWRDDPILARNIVSGRRYRTEWTNSRTYEERTLGEDEPLPEKFREDFFILATAWWPPDSPWSPPRAAGRPFAMHEVANSNEHCVVRPALEQVDGHWCHVLEHPGHDSLWIDDERPCIIMARELREPKSNALIEKYVLGGHREVAQRIWLPTWWDRVQYDFRAATAERRERVVGRTRATVVDMNVNDVDEELFAFHWQPGDAVSNRFTGEWRQTEPGGLEFLDARAASLRRLARGRAERWPSRLDWIAGTPFLGILALWEAWIRARGRVARKTSATNYATPTTA